MSSRLQGCRQVCNARRLPATLAEFSFFSNVPLLTIPGNEFLYNITRLYVQRVACEMDIFAEEVDGSLWLWSREREQDYKRVWDGRQGRLCKLDLGSPSRLMSVS